MEESSHGSSSPEGDFCRVFYLNPKALVNLWTKSQVLQVYPHELLFTLFFIWVLKSLAVTLVGEVVARRPFLLLLPTRGLAEPEHP